MDDLLRACLSPATLLLDSSPQGDGVSVLACLAANTLLGSAAPARVVLLAASVTAGELTSALRRLGVPDAALASRLAIVQPRAVGVDPCAPLDSDALLAALESAVYTGARPAVSDVLLAAAASSTSSFTPAVASGGGGAAGGVLVLVDDAAALIEGCGSAWEGVCLLRGILALGGGGGGGGGGGAAESGPPPAGGHRAPTAFDAHAVGGGGGGSGVVGALGQWRLPHEVCVTICLPGCGTDVAVSAPAGSDGAYPAPGVGVGLQAHLTRHACATLTMAGLPTGYLRDVQGRAWLTPANASRGQGRAGWAGALCRAGGGGSGDGVSRGSGGGVSFLYRVAEHGRLRPVGDVTTCTA